MLTKQYLDTKILSQKKELEDKINHLKNLDAPNIILNATQKQGNTKIRALERLVEKIEHKTYTNVIEKLSYIKFFNNDELVLHLKKGKFGWMVAS